MGIIYLLMKHKITPPDKVVDAIKLPKDFEVDDIQVSHDLNAGIDGIFKMLYFRRHLRVI